MLARYAVAYLATGITFAAIDAIWLSWAGANFYRPVIGSLMADKPRMDAAIAFYLIYLAGIVFFAVSPAMAHGGAGWRTALLYGAAFGFFAYATYDLTNQATLKIWALKITLADMAWGSFVTAAAATMGYLVTKAVVK